MFLKNRVFGGGEDFEDDIGEAAFKFVFERFFDRDYTTVREVFSEPAFEGREDALSGRFDFKVRGFFLSRESFDVSIFDCKAT